MARRNSGRGGRSSRKRRSSQPHAGGPAITAAEEPRPQAASTRPTGRDRRAREAKQRSLRGVSDATAVGERPRAPWHPLPLSELLILVGAIGAVVAWQRGPQSNGSLLAAGITAVVIGTVEFTLREHLSGYRSHAIILALLPAIAFHTVVVLIVLALGSVPRWLNLALVPIDGAIFAFAFKLLRARFRDARRERIFAAGG